MIHPRIGGQRIGAISPNPTVMAVNPQNGPCVEPSASAPASVQKKASVAVLALCLLAGPVVGAPSEEKSEPDQAKEPICLVIIPREMVGTPSDDEEVRVFMANIPRPGDRLQAECAVVAAPKSQMTPKSGEEQ